jgi:hypothetical protein
MFFSDPSYGADYQIIIWIITFVFFPFAIMTTVLVFREEFKDQRYISAIRAFVVILLMVLVFTYFFKRHTSLSNAADIAASFHRDIVILEATESPEVVASLKAKFVLMKTKEDYDAIQKIIIPLKESAVKILSASPSEDST